MATLQRLRTSRAIREALRHGRRRTGTLLSVHVRDRGDTDPVRIAVVASRRVGTAVRRNRAKRLLREAGRRVTWPAGADAVLVARPACADSGMAAVEDELGALLDELRVGS